MIGVFGGTFDPVHFGHLRPALEVCQALKLQELRLVPCHVPPHRGMPRASAEQRLAMLRLAVEGVPGFVVDDRELRRPGPSYMVDTLASLRAEYPEKPLCLILGLDAFTRLDTWHRWRDLTDLAHIVVTRRPGSRLPEGGAVVDLVETAQCHDPRELGLRVAGAIYFEEVTQLDISATEVRRSLAQGLDVRFLVPEPVRLYMEEYGLYRI